MALDGMNWRGPGARRCRSAAVLLLEIIACCQAPAAVVEFTNRLEWEHAVKHVTAVPAANTELENQKNVPLNVGLVTFVASGRAWTKNEKGTNDTLKLTGSGTTAPSFRYDVTINGGKVCAIGWDWTNGGQPGMYKSVLVHDGGTIEKMWPGPDHGFLGYVDTKGKTISGFWFGSTGGCNFTGANVENICLSNLQPPPGVDSVPPQWATFEIQWKPTWEETLAANPEEQWQKELAADGPLPPELKAYLAKNSDAAAFVVKLRRITLLKAMIERFPDDKAKHAEAYKLISQTSREIMLPWWPEPKTSPLGKLNEFPAEFELATRWEAFVGAAKLHGPKQVIYPNAIQGIRKLCDRTDAYLQLNPSHYAFHPAALDRMLRTMSPEQLAPLREAEEAGVRELAGEVGRAGDPDEVLKFSRRAPWASSVHQLLLQLGERSLQEGRRHWALASFNDVIDHASDPEIRLEAQVGLWVALAQDASDRDMLESALTAVPDDVQLPWRGDRIAAGELKKLLLATNARTAVKLASLDRKMIQLPPTWPAEERNADGPSLDFGLHAPWPVSQVQATRDALWVFGPLHVARFHLDGSGPVWMQPTAEAAAPPWNPAAADTYIKDVLQGTKLDRRPVTPRGAQSSAVSEDGSTIYCLVTAGTPTAVALDATTGTRLWSTATRPDWRQITPMSRPVAADGRVYVLAIPAGLAPNAGAGPGKEPGPPVTWQLVCMDGRDGRVLWTRTLGWQPYTLLDLARASNGITIRQGVVYCSTDMGLVARCDARDGSLDWVRGYASTPETDPRANTFSREGSRPLVADNAVFVAPRDHSGVLAFRCDTGECLWETIAVPSDRLLGVRKNVVLAVSPRLLCALDIHTGKTMWSREFPEGTGSQGAMLGDDVVIASAGKLHRLAVANGSTVETVDLGPAAAAAPVLLDDGSLVGLKGPAPAGSP